MTVTAEPWLSPPASASNVRLVRVPLSLLTDISAARSMDRIRIADVELSPYILGPQCTGLWKMRARQLEAHPVDAEWVTRIVIDTERAASVGAAGFHGRPDEHGMVELGYRIDPVERRSGYARAALETMLHVVSDDARVTVVRATISPDNAPSRTLIDQYGFVEVGEQWDEEDGLEIIFERPSGSRGATS